MVIQGVSRLQAFTPTNQVSPHPIQDVIQRVSMYSVDGCGLANQPIDLDLSHEITLPFLRQFQQHPIVLKHAFPLLNICSIDAAGLTC